MRTIDLNADLGETDDELAEADTQVLRFVTSVNVSCGAHAGTPESIAATVRSALRQGVALGAHPSYPDREGFGRVSMIGAGSISEDALRRSLRDQITWLSEVADKHGGRLRYVKPHGALYHDVAQGGGITERVSALVAEFGLPLVGMSDAPGEVVARSIGVRWIREAFADRRYEAPAKLVPRSVKGAVLTETGQVLRQIDRLLDWNVETICIHGDTPGARELASAIRLHLEGCGVALGPVV